MAENEAYQSSVPTLVPTYLLKEEAFPSHSSTAGIFLVEFWSMYNLSHLLSLCFGLDLAGNERTSFLHLPKKKGKRELLPR